MLRTASCGWSWLLLFLIVYMTLPDQTSVSNATPQPTWQYSITPVAQLGVRDKYGTLGKYTAVWIASAPDGRQYQAKVTVEGNDNGYVYFPNDFEAIPKPGRYSWKVLVDEREVASGNFDFKTVETYSDQLTVQRLAGLHR